jgi:Ca2+-binding EF-hand superfamily protein
MTRRNLLVALIILTFAGVDKSVAQKSSVPKQQDKAVLANPHVQELLLLMDADKNGKISKQERMKFMEAEFDRLDKDKSGELTPHELELSKVRVTSKSFAAVGK